MRNIHLNTIPDNKIPTSIKKCEVCGFRAMKSSQYCYRHNPDYSKEYHFPAFNKLTTVEGIQRAYGNLLNALRKGKIPRQDATALFYGLNSFIKSMKDILDMKIELDKSNPEAIITDSKIEQLKVLVDKLEDLQQQFKSSNDPVPSGEIPQTAQDTLETQDR